MKDLKVLNSARRNEVPIDANTSQVEHLREGVGCVFRDGVTSQMQ